jgi:23S rRNA (uracil1939-C5)-methyltransferase
MQHLTVDGQIAWKQKTLLEQLQHIGHVTPETVLPPLASSAWGYRHKARLGARYMEREERVFVGFRRKFRHSIADLDSCEVLHPAIANQLPALSALLTSLECKAQIPQMEVAVGDDHPALIIRHMVPLTPEDRVKILAFAQGSGVQIYLQPNPPEPITKLWPEDGVERLHYELPDFNIQMRFHPTDFTQIHLDLNRLMVKQAMTLLDPQPDESVLDLFCGVGNFSLPLARLAKKVTGIEGSQIMVERAYENAAHNQITNADFFAANLFELPVEAAWFKQTYDKILIDPPRTGAKEILEFIARFKAKKIVYVSCNPATLARDADYLVNTLGYQLRQAGMMNMFPHTSHIEAMAVFERES